MVHYKEIGRCLQIEQSLCHVNAPELNKLIGNELTQDHIVSKDEGISLFNQAAETVGLNPLRDPKGYMALDNNVYEVIKDTYADKYEEALDNIEGGFGFGTTYAVESVLNKLDAEVRSNVKEHLPKGVNYSDLRFIAATPELEDVIDRFATKRVEMTLMKSISRSIEQERFDKTVNEYHAYGNKLGEMLSGQSNEMVR